MSQGATSVEVDAKAKAEAEVETYLKAHGQPNRVEVLVCDCNGIYRGKWFPGSDLGKLVTSGTNFPISLLFGDLTCETPSELLQPPLAGDPDGIYCYVPNSLQVVPWRDQATAQIQLQLQPSDGEGALDPRHLLEQYINRHDVRGFVALEGEFELRGHSSALVGEQVYSHQALEEAEPFLATAYELAAHHGVELTSVLPEYGDGQFEVNLRHRASALRAADEYQMSKRVLKAAANMNGKQASFIALPSTNGAGNGCHIHISLTDPSGANLLANDVALSAVANGVLSTVNECIALLAPHANSYRRIDLGGEFNAPCASWGENHRGTMLRVPKSDAKNRRVEFRLAGADVNPYLLTLYVLAAMRHGLAMAKPCAVAKSNAGAPLQLGFPLITRWHQAIDALEGSAFARSVFGDAFIDLYVRMKRLEERKFHAQVSDIDLLWAGNVV